MKLWVFKLCFDGFNRCTFSCAQDWKDYVIWNL